MPIISHHLKISVKTTKGQTAYYEYIRLGFGPKKDSNRILCVHTTCVRSEEGLTLFTDLCMFVHVCQQDWIQTASGHFLMKKAFRRVRGLRVRAPQSRRIHGPLSVRDVL